MFKFLMKKNQTKNNNHICSPNGSVSEMVMAQFRYKPQGFPTMANGNIAFILRRPHFFAC